MLYGRWNCVIDEKWRLVIPAAFRDDIGSLVVLSLNEDDCVVMLPLPDNFLFRWLKMLMLRLRSIDTSEIYIVKVKVEENPIKRFLIPSPLREANSFYFGRNITLAGKGKFFEVWPRP